MSKKNVGIWLRVSTDDQAKGDSPEHHEERARTYAKFKNWNIVEVYHLEGVSGKQVLHHPEAQRMVRDVMNGKITGLIFSKLARLARNTKELLELSDFFNEHQADLISLEEDVDTSSPSGRLFYTLISAVSQWEREEIASRVRASVPIRAKLGKCTGGAAPYGYEWVDNELHLNEEEAPIRKLVYELFTKEKRRKTVARMINERGYRTRRGKIFSSQTVTNMLKDPITKGLRRVNYTTMKNGLVTAKPEEDWVFVKAPAIVSEELWEECNRILDQQTFKRKPAKRVSHLFSSHIKCHCGGKMYVVSNSPKYVCRACKNKIAIDDMNAIFHHELKGFLFSREKVQDYLSDAKNTIQDKQKELEALKKKERTLSEELANMIRLNTKGVLSDDDFPDHYNPVSEQRSQLRTHVAEMESELTNLNQYILDSDQILDETKDLHSRWEHLTFEDKRSIVELIVQDIIVGTEEIEINLLCSQSAMFSHHPLLKGGKKVKNPLRISYCLSEASL